MISVSHINAIVRRYTISIFTGDIWRLVECLYWPMIDALLFGMTGLAVDASAASFRTLCATTALWPVVIGVNLEICVNVLNEIWDPNLVNLFSTPLKCIEWMLGLMVVGVFRALIVIPTIALMLWLCFQCNILAWPLLLFAGLFIMCGWAIGFISAGIIIFWGINVQQVAWMGGWFFAVLSAVYCPLEKLPLAIQSVIYWLPTTQSFRAVRLYYQHGVLSWEIVGFAFILSLIFLAGSMIFFNYMFEKSRASGLARR